MFNKKNAAFSKWRPSTLKKLSSNAKKERKLKLQKIRRVYAKERKKQREHMNSEIAGIDKLLEEGSIDEDIHARYKKLLEMGYADKRRETREKYDLTN